VTEVEPGVGGNIPLSMVLSLMFTQRAMQRLTNKHKAGTDCWAKQPAMQPENKTIMTVKSC
jgi:hypothetical protein